MRTSLQESRCCRGNPKEKRDAFPKALFRTVAPGVAKSRHAMQVAPEQTRRVPAHDRVRVVRVLEQVAAGRPVRYTGMRDFSRKSNRVSVLDAITAFARDKSGRCDVSGRQIPEGSCEQELPLLPRQPLFLMTGGHSGRDMQWEISRSLGSDHMNYSC